MDATWEAVNPTIWQLHSEPFVAKARVVNGGWFQRVESLSDVRLGDICELLSITEDKYRQVSVA